MLLYRISKFTTKLQYFVVELLYALYTLFSMSVICCNDVDMNAAKTEIGFSIRTLRAYILRSPNILNVPCKICVTFKIYSPFN